MRFLMDISIRNRMMAIFAIFIIFFVAFGFFGISQIEKVTDLAQDLYDNNLQASNAIAGARADILKIQSKMKDTLTIYDQMEIQKQIKEIERLNQFVDDQLSLVETHTRKTEIVQMEKQVNKMLAEWRENQENMLELVVQGRNDLAVVLSKTKDAEFMQQLEEELGQMHASIKVSTNDLMEHTDKLKKSQRSMYILWMAIFCIISFIVFTCIIRSIIHPITLLKNTMSSSATTGELIEAEFKGRNEITNMAKHYNILVNKLKNQFWIKDNQNLLNEELWGDISLNELAQKTINFLARAMDAGNGVFYIYDQDTKTLSLQASFAFTERNRLSNRYELGEGIVGQVAMEKKPILLKNVTKQESLISTGTCSEKPFNIYAFPLVHEDDLYGVIELSFFEPFSQLKQEYLFQVSRIVSINLYSVLQNQQIKELLDFSEQAHKEAMRSAEDLQKANQILEEQQQQLQQQSEELQHTNVQLEEQQQMLEEQSGMLNMRNEELENSRQELYNRTTQLEQSNKYKSEFLANMSHELRTPLNSIILLSKLISKNQDGVLGEKELEKVNVIYNSGQELLRLINDILDLSKIESGRLDLNISKFHSNELVMELKQLFREAAEEKKIWFDVEDSVNLPLMGDREKISQILRNLLSNAIKFTEKGSVTLEVIPSPENENSVVFSVVDTGIGISKEKLTEIFEEFKQGDGSISRKYGGTGLGLSISKKLSELMNGEIRVVSKEGRGSTFSLYLNNVIANKMSATAYEQAAVTSENTSQERQDIRFSPKSEKTIVIIEDDINFAQYIKQVGNGMGFDTLIALTGKSGLEYIQKNKVDGILLDLVLPDMTGIEVLKELKSIEEVSNIPIHIITEKEVTAEQHKILKQYADSMIIKKANCHERLLDEITLFLHKVSKTMQSKHYLYSKTSNKHVLNLLGKKILIADDDARNIFVLASALENYGAEIIEAENGNAVLEKLAEHNVDLILVDIMMPVMDGYETIKEVRMNKKLRHIPIIAVTAKSLKGDKEKCIEAGANDYISKPVDFDVLIRLVKAWIDKSISGESDSNEH